ncbi:hypothetical protein M422DRAFT_242481 [Sphaerobolus stellatus SS14]|nr:hypothetical protein M422DRAFT_242481 [Sphaerobolus stellatus SS14]
MHPLLPCCYDLYAFSFFLSYCYPRLFAALLLLRFGSAFGLNPASGLQSWLLQSSSALSSLSQACGPPLSPQPDISSVRSVSAPTRVYLSILAYAHPPTDIADNPVLIVHHYWVCISRSFPLSSIALN